MSTSFTIASSTGIEVWPLRSCKGLWRIPIDIEERSRCVAISKDAKLIVSGHEDGTVRQWDGHAGEPIGQSMSNHTVVVTSVDIRGNLTVSGSNDGLLYRYIATTGEVIGNALQGSDGSVRSVSISAGGKLIVADLINKTAV